MEQTKKEQLQYLLYLCFIFIVIKQIDMDLNSLDKKQKLTIQDENIKASVLPPSLLSSNSTRFGSQVCSFESKQIAKAHENKNQGSASLSIDIAKTELGASHSQSIFIRKEREKESDQHISRQWKNARKNFFRKQITQKLIEDKIEEHQHQRIVQMLLNQQGKIEQHNLANLIWILSKQKGSQATGKQKREVISVQLQMARKHHELMKYLNKQLQAIEKAFKQKQRQCFPIVQIIQQKITCLKTIHIQYQTKLNKKFQQEYIYFVSAFEFFKLIHDNGLLTKVTVKGVFIDKFQQFINSTSQTIEEEDLCWINDFNPSKELQLTINTNITFDVGSANKAYSCLSDLTFFIGLFSFVSDIRVKIYLSEWKYIGYSVDILKSIWDQLRKIRNLKLQIKGRGYSCPFESVMIARSAIFGQLSSFTGIVQLSLFRIDLSSCFAAVNIFLVIEEILNLLFENNQIKSFRIIKCLYFPIIPKTNSLELFYLFQDNTPFRKNISCMPNAVRTNLNLKNIKLQRGGFFDRSSTQVWEIDDKLMNQLQTLQIFSYSDCDCNTISLINISTQSISNMKYLRIKSCNIEGEQFLSVTFPKFAKLTRLELSYVNFRHEILSLLSSPSLQELAIQQNNIITDQCLQVIDSKWPKIKFLCLYKCEKMTGNAWSICEFKGLVQLKCDQSILKKGMAAFLDLKRQGVKVQYLTY